MTIKFSDFNAPTSLCIATGTELIPLENPAGAVAFVGAAVQSGIGDPVLAQAIQQAVDSAFVAAKQQLS